MGHVFVYIISVFDFESSIVLSHTVHISLYLYVNTSFPHKATIKNAGKKKKNAENLTENHTIPHGFRNPSKTINEENSSLFLNSILQKGKNEGRNLRSEKSQSVAQKPQRNCTFMNSISGRWLGNVLEGQRVGIYTEHKTIGHLFYFYTYSLKFSRNVPALVCQCLLLVTGVTLFPLFCWDRMLT